MEFPATYALALDADRRRMDAGRLDGPVSAPAARGRSARGLLGLLAGLARRPRRRAAARRAPSACTAA